jgi:signal transduction histidine kinase
MLRGVALARRIAVETEVAPELHTLWIDPGKLKQVLYNYLSNALKFTPEGGRVAVRMRPDDTDSFRLEVEDSGEGIRSEDLARLFVPFEQLDSGSTKRHQGTGLGLALTRRLVEAQGGRVGVRSEPGTGSAFFVVLPRGSQAPPRGSA